MAQTGRSVPVLTLIRGVAHNRSARASPGIAGLQDKLLLAKLNSVFLAGLRLAVSGESAASHRDR